MSLLCQNNICNYQGKEQGPQNKITIKLLTWIKNSKKCQIQGSDEDEDEIEIVEGLVEKKVVSANDEMTRLLHVTNIVK